MSQFNCESVVIIDFETTGLSSRSDRVIEVGAVALEGKKLVGKFSQLMDPGDFLPYQITNITGITDEMLSGKPKPEDVMPQLIQFIGQRTIIAHNAGFDKKFLHSELARADIFSENPVLCTLKLARRLMPGLPSYSLSNLKDYLGIRVAKSHRALDDAEATSYLWRHLYETAQKLATENKLTYDFMEKLGNTSARKIHDLLYKRQLT